MLSTPSLPTTVAERWPRPAVPVLRGREEELVRCAEILRTAATARRGKVVSVVGEQGSGKTALLARIANEAKALGFRVARIGLVEECRPEMLARVLGRPGTALPDLHAGRASRPDDTPTLITVDDLRWSESGAALEPLFSAVTTLPLVCVLARRLDARVDHLDPLFRYLQDRDAVVHLPLHGLSAAAVTAMCVDAFGTEPDDALAELLACAEGRPGAVIGLLDDFVRTGVVRRANGVATLSPHYAGTPENAPLPDSVRALVQARLDHLSPQTHQALDVAAVLGRSFTPGDVAQLLGQPVAALTCAFREALMTGVVESVSDRMRFRHVRTWQVVLRGIPVPILGALRDQAAELMFSRRSCPNALAEHLMGATLHDERTLSMLSETAGQVLEASPRTAAGLALRGMEAMRDTDSDSGERLALTLIAVQACARSGPVSTAVALAEKTLLDDVPPESAAVLRYWLAIALTLQGHQDDAEEVAHVLAGAAVDGTDRVTRLREVRTVADVLLGIPAARPAVDGEHPPSSAVEAWQLGLLAQALRMSEEALSSDEAALPVSWLGHPLLVRAVLLTAVRDIAGARSAIAELERNLDPLLRGVPKLLSAKIDVVTGRSENAVEKAVECLGIARETDAHLYLPAALALLTALAARRADLAAKVAEEPLVVWASTEVVTRRTPALEWARAQLGLAQNHEHDCSSALDLMCGDPGTLRLVLAAEPVAAAWIVRTALATGRLDRAVTAADAAHRLAERNPEIRHLAMSAAHARALLDGGHDALVTAPEEHPDLESRASAAEDLGVALIDVDRDAAVSRLEEAVALYDSIEAQRDTARVQRRLRALGVVKRYGRESARHTTGLTKAERTISSLVVAGLTNKQIAARLFLSHHTVAFHLRKIFRKLGVGSRVELARAGRTEGF